MTGSEVKTSAEAAVRLGVSVMTIQRWAADGQLKPLRTSPLIFDDALVEAKAADLADEYRAKLAHLTGEAVPANG